MERETAVGEGSDNGVPSEERWSSGGGEVIEEPLGEMEGIGGSCGEDVVGDQVWVVIESGFQDERVKLGKSSGV